MFDENLRYCFRLDFSSLLVDAKRFNTIKITSSLYYIVLPKLWFMWGTFIEIINSFLGAFLILLGLIFIPEIRKSLKRIAIIVLLIIVLIIVGVVKISNDKSDRESNEKKLDELSVSLQTLRQAKTSDSLNRINDILRNTQFEKNLYDQFKILRDSSTNKPVIYNTHIEKATNVNIGNK